MIRATLTAALALGLLSACNVGPPYKRASVAQASVYKELLTDQPSGEGWKVAQPGDAQLHGKWWELYGDPKLNALEEQVNVSNQNIAAAFASFMQARALVKEAQSQYYPTLTTDPSVTRSRTSANLAPGGGGGAGVGGTTQTVYDLPFDASWTPDLWGRVRNTVKGNVAAAQASAADLENTRLTAQAELAVDYYELRTQDELQELLNDTVIAYQQALDLTKALYDTGIDADEAVAQAEVQLQTAQAQATNLGIARAQYEHAIALLIGQPASSFTLPVEPQVATVPTIPVGVPSQLLERRPDISANERLMVQANAQIGVAKAAYFPTLTLSATGGFESSSISNWLAWPSRFFSVGPSLAETLFDAGLRSATVAQYRAAYDAAVANYRQTVLTAFQQVEDNLAALRILALEIKQQDDAVAAAKRYLDIATSRYQLGLDPYLNVITAQTTLLTNQQTDAQLRMQQLVGSVQLIEALGGGWDTSQLPSGH
jgi:NodT family efflux transporter outer membrane factor (OMF) lipoprotein